ncbi:MAG: hypothetical protein N2560_04320 [Ignavibacteria bacterium]|nr:hypothetical protein [Ignavibacteria bacterium]
MEKFSLGFGIPFWVLLIFLLASFFITYLYYRRTNPEVDLRSKLFLGGLRFLALLLLFFSFSEPIANFISNKFQKPKIVALIDNSASMKLKWQGVDKFSQTKNALESADLNSFTKYPIDFAKFDTKIKFIDNFKFDSLKFDGTETNLHIPLQRIYEIKQAENIQALVIFTDGIVNSGENPAYLAERFGVPIYTIGIGDSVPPKDIVVTSITTNEIAFVDKTLPVKVNIKSFGYTNQPLNIQLFDGQNLVGEQTVKLDKGIEDYSIMFEFTPKTEGFAKLTAKTKPLDEEFSIENNSQSQIVKVIKSKKKYVIVSGYPNPDISYIKSLISQEVGSEVITFIQKFRGEFYDPPPTRKDFEEAQIFILIGFPIASSNTQILDWIKEEWQKGKSVLFISQLETDYRKLKPYEEFLPFNFVSNTVSEYTFVANFNPSQIGNPLLNIVPGEDNLKLLNQLPPLFRTELFVRTKPESEILAFIKVNNVEMREPFLLLNNFQNRKSAAILGYGLFRWRLLGFSLKEIIGGEKKDIDVGSELMSKLLQWLTVTDETAKVRIRPSKPKFTSTEPVVFNAQIYDESMNPVDNANVIVKITKGNEVYERQLQQVSSGLYSVAFGSFAEGDYNYVGEAYVGNKQIGKVAGRFIVEKSNLELIDFRSRFDFLRYISKSTGGKFYLWNEMTKFKEELYNLDLEERVVTQKREVNIWNSLYLLLFSIAFFSLEWFFRRKKGLL